MRKRKLLKHINNNDIKARNSLRSSSNRLFFRSIALSFVCSLACCFRMHLLRAKMRTWFAIAPMRNCRGSTPSVSHSAGLEKQGTLPRDRRRGFTEGVCREACVLDMDEEVYTDDVAVKDEEEDGYAVDGCVDELLMHACNVPCASSKRVNKASSRSHSCQY